MGKPISQIKPFSNDPKWEDAVQFIEFPDNKLVLLRIVGDIEVLSRHWIKTITGKSFPAWCPQFDSVEEVWDERRPCPAHDDFQDKAQKVIIGNAIIRSLQERGEDSPVRGFMLPHATNDDLRAIAELIKIDPADKEKGVDIAVKYNPKAAGNKKWSLQRGNETPLTKEEQKYDYYDFTKIVPNFAEAKIAAEYAKRMKESMARSKYYVVQEQRIPEGARDPFKYFKGDVNGKPWTDFSELVDFRNDTQSDKAQTHKKTGDDEPEEKIDEGPRSRMKHEDDDDPPARTTKKAPVDEEEAPPAKTKLAVVKDDDEAPPAKTKPKAEDDEAPPPAKTKPKAEEEAPAKAKQDGYTHPDANIKSMVHVKFGSVPVCFEKYTGEPKCHRCPIRSKCIDLTQTDDL